MKQRIRALEQEAKSLEPDAEERRHYRDQVIEYGEQFLQRLPDMPAYDPAYREAERLLDSGITEEPFDVRSVLDEIRNSVDRPGINTASDGHLGYIPGCGLYLSALGDYLAAVTNRYAGVHYSSPGAVNIERRLIRWMADLTGYPSTAGGYMASGGSMANLTAITAAREHFGIRAREVENTVVYTTTHAHHCIDRALRVNGLGECIRRHIPMDERYRMRAGELDNAIREDLRRGLRPWLLVGSAGTTDAGAVDPLNALADVASEHGLWYHVDAAYGGFFMLAGGTGHLFDGIQRSDSVVVDPHKGLFLPYGLGVLLVRDEATLAEAHRYQADYMQDVQEPGGVRSPADTSPELSRHFRGMRLWLPLKWHGLRPFRKALEEKLELTRYAYRQLADTRGFEVGPEPDLSVFLFRYMPDDEDPESFNRRLQQAILDEGQVYISSTRINGTFMLRLAILSARTHLDTIDRALQQLREKAGELLQHT